MKDTPQQIEDRARSIRDNPPEEIPMPVIVKREPPLPPDVLASALTDRVHVDVGRGRAVKVDRCPTCGARR